MYAVYPKKGGTPWRLAITPPPRQAKCFLSNCKKQATPKHQLEDSLFVPISPFQALTHCFACT